MKFLIEKPGEKLREIEGSEARRELRAFLRWASTNILTPEPPFTGIVRRRIIRRLRNGGRVWTHPDGFGHATKRSTIMVAAVTVEVII